MRALRIRSFAAAACASLLPGIALPAAGGEPPSYTARLLTPDFSFNNAAGMNDAGDVVGTTTYSAAWVSRGGAPAELLPLPAGAQYAFAYDINDAGVIVGAAGSAAYPGFGRAVAWVPDGAGGYTVHELGTLPGHLRSAAAALNDVGDIVGSSSDGTYSYPALFSLTAAPLDLSATGVFDPADVNDSRVLVDHSFTCKRLDLDTMIVEDLGTPGPGYQASRCEAINASGQTAGSVVLSCCYDCDVLAARYTDGPGWETLSGCGQYNSAWDINDLGDVVSRLNLAPHVDFHDLGSFVIEDLITAEVGHWYVINGYGLTINNGRQMAVPATNPELGLAGVVLLTPVVPAIFADGFESGDTSSWTATIP